VKLREKVLANGHRSLYLDVYHRGKRSYEFLKLYLTGSKEHDAEMLRLAETIRSQREIELHASEHGLVPSHRRKANFVDFFDTVAEKRHKSWRAAGIHLREFTGGTLTFDQITTAKLEALKLYLSEHLSNNSAWLYFGKVRGALHEAVRQGYLQSNPCADMQGPARERPIIAYLTLEDIKALKATPCVNDTVRRAFLFSCFSGLAKCDVRGLTWEQVHDGRIVYRRKKTNELVMVPLHPEAVAALGTSGHDAELVFPNLPCDRHVTNVLTKWLQRAGITKNVTFHGARHTFATLSLTYGADVLTVSKLLGHVSVKFTQHYAKVIDRVKEEAVMRVPVVR
jgi:integrase